MHSYVCRVVESKRRELQSREMASCYYCAEPMLRVALSTPLRNHLSANVPRTPLLEVKRALILMTPSSTALPWRATYSH